MIHFDTYIETIKGADKYTKTTYYNKHIRVESNGNSKQYRRMKKTSMQLRPKEDWIAIKGGESFNVTANSSFDLKVTQLADYCCSYLD